MECKANNGPFQSPTNEVSLEAIGIKYKTAKVPHGYLPIYERFFRDTEVNSLLEIGVADGASIKMWREYFPDAHIIGIDKNLTYQNDDVELIEADATNPNIFNGRVDIIIDDASHIAAEQVNTFRNLWGAVKPGGLYVIEDLFTLYDKVWNPYHWNIIEFINNEMKSILTEGSTITEVHYYGRNDTNGILFLRKRKEKFRIQPLSEFEM